MNAALAKQEEMLKALDEVGDQVLRETIANVRDLPKDIDELEKFGENLLTCVLGGWGRLREVKYEIISTTALESMIISPHTRPQARLQSIRLQGELLNKFPKKSPLVAIQNNIQNNHYESKLAEAHKILAERKNGSADGSSD